MANSVREQRQRKGLILGSAFIVIGIIGAFWSYYQDSNSFDIIRMVDATEFAILHAVLWTIVGLGFMAFFVKAAVEALKAYPLVNARIDGGDIVMQHFYNIGVAVSTDKGLMVPVLRDADEMSFADIEKAIAAVAVKARDGKIGVADLQGGTFTITNGGIFGSMMSTPILNPPQSAILGMHAIQKRPVANGDEVVIRPMMYLALSYDHRLIDGREAVSFLVRIKECIEGPERMLLDI